MLKEVEEIKDDVDTVVVSEEVKEEVKEEEVATGEETISPDGEGINNEEE